MSERDGETKAESSTVTVAQQTHREFIISHLEMAIEHLRDETTTIKGSDVHGDRNHRFIREEDADEEIVTLLPADTFSGQIHLRYEIPIPENEREDPRRINPKVAGHDQVAVVGENESPIGVSGESQTDE